MKKNTVVFFLIGNETYEPRVFNSLNNLKSLKHAFVYNPPTKVSKKALIGGILGNIIDTGTKQIEAPGSIYRDARISFTLQSRFKNININYPFSNLPQGYSNNFSSKITTLVKTKEIDSLISKDFLRKVSEIKEVKYKFSFIGQSGNRRREAYLKSAQSFKETKVYPLEDGFGGNKEDRDFTYIKTLLSSDFILVPPGSFNNSNHRYTESLICQSLPVILANNSIDPSQNDNWTNNLSFIRRYSVKSQMKHLEKISDSTFEKYYSAASFIDFKKILDTKHLINSLIG